MEAYIEAGVVYTIGFWELYILGDPGTAPASPRMGIMGYTM